MSRVSHSPSRGTNTATVRSTGTNTATVRSTGTKTTTVRSTGTNTAMVRSTGTNTATVRSTGTNTATVRSMDHKCKWSCRVPTNVTRPGSLSCTILQLYHPATGFYNYIYPTEAWFFLLYHPATGFHNCSNTKEAWLFLQYHPATGFHKCTNSPPSQLSPVPPCNQIPQSYQLHIGLALSPSTILQLDPTTVLPPHRPGSFSCTRLHNCTNPTGSALSPVPTCNWIPQPYYLLSSSFSCTTLQLLYQPVTRFHNRTNSTAAWFSLLYHPATRLHNCTNPHRLSPVPACNWIPQLYVSLEPSCHWIPQVYQLPTELGNRAGHWVTLLTVLLIHQTQGGWGLGLGIVGVQSVVPQCLAVVCQGLHREPQ